MQERRNLFYRQDEIRTKSFAANLDQVLILIAAEPVFSESQLARALIAAEAAHITPLIALNKTDLVEPFARAWERLLPYRHMARADGQHHLRRAADEHRAFQAHEFFAGHFKADGEQQQDHADLRQQFDRVGVLDEP